MKKLKTYLEKREYSYIDTPIIFNRVSLSRNIAGYKFELANSLQDRKKILATVKKELSGISDFDDYNYYNLSLINATKRSLLAEGNIISEPMLNKVKGRGVMFWLGNENSRIITSIMINEEDHLKIQGLIGSLGMKELYKHVTGIEKKLERKLNFAFDGNLGYLVSSPALVGSGLEISFLAHLPAMVMSFKINDLIKNLNKLNCTLQGYNIQDSEALGNLFLISKENPLEADDLDTVEEMNAICLNIIEREKLQTAELKKEMPVAVVDNIWRSYGVVKHAKLLSFEEAIELLSMLKLGSKIGVLDNLNEFDFYHLINIIGNSYIKNYLAKDGANTDDIDKMRADILKNEIFL